MAYSKSLVERIRHLFSRQRGITEKKMFGGVCFLLNGNLLVGVDPDTTGAICGQLAGAYWGESGISQSLRSGLAGLDMPEKAMAGLLTKQHSP